MPTIFYVSYVALWVLLLVQGILLLLVYRHFGLAALGTAEGVQRDGLPVGEIAPPIRGVTVQGEAFELIPQPGQLYLLTFVSPTCAPCAEILPAIHQVTRVIDEVKVVLVVDGSRERVVQLIERFHPPTAVTCLAEGDTGIYRGYLVRVTPFAFMIGKDGLIRSKGLCNTTSRLRQLLSSVGKEVSRELVESASEDVSQLAQMK